MSIFGNILSKIFHAGGATAQTAATPDAGASAGAAPGAPDAPPASAPPTSGAPAGSSAAPVDVEAVLTAMASQKGGGGNWQSSIVDLLKLLDLDSSLDARKALANELNLHVAADGSAEENIALHKAVMQKLEENGGKVPASLKG